MLKKDEVSSAPIKESLVVDPKEIQKSAMKQEVRTYWENLMTEVASIWQEKQTVVNWIEANKDGFNDFVFSLMEFSEVHEGLKGDLFTDLIQIQNEAKKEDLISRIDAKYEEFQKFFHEKVHIFNQLKQSLRNYLDGWEDPETLLDYSKITSISQLDSIYNKFLQNGEIIQDVETELKNNVKTCNRMISTLNKAAQEFNSFITVIKNLSKMDSLRSSNIKFSSSKIQLEQLVIKEDRHKIEEKIRLVRKREIIKSRMIRGDSDELKALQANLTSTKGDSFTSPINKISATKPTISFRDLAIISTQIPIYNLNSGAFENAFFN